MKKYILIVALAFAAMGMVSAAESSKAEQSAAGLASLSINGPAVSVTLSASELAAKCYFLTVPFGTTSVTIAAVPASDGSKVTGAGKVQLSYTSNYIPVTVTSADGSSSTFLLAITREGDR
jgi:hypothetical protein